MDDDDREYQAMLSMSKAAQDAADAMHRLSAAVQNFRFSLAELVAVRFPQRAEAEKLEEDAARAIAKAKKRHAPSD